MITIQIYGDTPAEEVQEFTELFSAKNIYDDVAQLQKQMTEVKDLVGVIDARTKCTVLTSDTDLNNLTAGTYLIPTSAVSSSLLNKPTTSSVTGVIKVIPGGSSGQLIMYYIPCADSPSYYQRAYYLGAWQPWHEVNLYDSSWITLPLQNGASAYNTAQVPQYRKVGNQVFIRGVFRGIIEACTVAILPTAFRPSQRIMFNLPRTGYQNTRFEIETTGQINYIGSNEPINENIWFSFSNTSFSVN